MDALKPFMAPLGAAVGSIAALFLAAALVRYRQALVARKLSAAPAEASRIRAMLLYANGAALVVVVVLLWTGSNVILQLIYREYFKPIFITYFSFSLQAICLVFYPTRVSATVTALRRSIAACISREPVYSNLSPEVITPVDRARQALGTALRLCALIVPGSTLFNASLVHVSVTAVTLVSSSSSMWTLLFSAVKLGEEITIAKVAAVFVTTLGIFCIVSEGGSRNSEHDGRRSHFWLNASYLTMVAVSAMLYGLYSVQLKIEIPNERILPLPYLFGLLGAVTLCLGWPVVLAAHVSGVETFSMPPLREALVGAGNALFATVLANVLLARAALLASPLVVVVGMSLSIPLAMVSDVVRQEAELTPLALAGVALVWCGFLGVSAAGQADGTPAPRCCRGTAR